MKNKPKVGQQLFALNINNNARHRTQELKPVKVLSVGRKYFKAIPIEYIERPHMAIEYHLGDWYEKTEYTPGWKLYENEQEWTDEKEHSHLCESIRSRIGAYGKIGCSLSCLREISKLLNEDDLKQTTQPTENV